MHQEGVLRRSPKEDPAPTEQAHFGNEASGFSVGATAPVMAPRGLVINQHLQVFSHIHCCQTCSPTSYTLKINFLKLKAGLRIHPYSIFYGSAWPGILTCQEKFPSWFCHLTYPSPFPNPCVISRCDNYLFPPHKVTDKMINNSKAKDRVLRYCRHP